MEMLTIRGHISSKSKYVVIDPYRMAGGAVINAEYSGDQNFGTSLLYV